MLSTGASAPRKVRRAIGPKLRKLLYVVFALLALLGANSGYLASITAIQWLTGRTYENYFYFLMFLGHLVLGLLLIVPFIVFGVIHMLNSRGRRNRRAIRVGYALFAACCGVLLTGLLLVRIENVIDLRHPTARSVVYWLHVGLPLGAGWLYWIHRLVGPKFKWKVGLSYAGVVAATVLAMAGLHSTDPRGWNVQGPESGDAYFKPSLARTATGNFIPAESLMNDQYCLKCHADIHKDWSKSAHKNSSFSNPAYLVSIRETRDVTLKRDGNVQASRWCAGCHDPAPFFSGAFDKPDFDVVNDETAHAGITCTVCHAITNVNSTRGNADYTIEEPLHYPFAFSDSPTLQWVNEQLIKAKPGFHKKTFLKDFHASPEFCSTCHKVSLPFELNHYKEFLRGQNHYDSYHLSGVSGHGARSFYYPPVAQENCNGCHMPALASNDFGARVLDDSGELKVHDHLFPGANTAVPWWNGHDDAVRRQQEFLHGCVRVDLFGVREDGEIDGKLTAPLRPLVPTLKPGETYLFEAVIRTLTLGHLFTQGTVDSNEVWLEVLVKSGDRVLGHSGVIDERSELDPGAHRVNVFLLDRKGNRINRRNPQDIFTPLYNHQIPPGAGQTVHYKLRLPNDVDAPVTVVIKLHYRKFDREFVEDFVTGKSLPGDRPIRGYERGKPYGNPLPITTLAVDHVTFPVEGVDAIVANEPRDDIPEWQRWNDYGIGSLLKGKAELAIAQEAFREVEKLGRYDGPLNLARALNIEGDVLGAVAATARAAECDDPPAPPWTLSWLSGVLNSQLPGKLKEAEENLRATLEMRTEEMVRRKFDFSQDYMVRNELADVLYKRAQQVRLPTEIPQDPKKKAAYEERKRIRDGILEAAVHELHKTLDIDSENLTAHYLLMQIHSELGNNDLSEKHAKLHERYRPDDSAQGEATRKARVKYPEAALSAEKVAIYVLGDVEQ